MEANGPKLGLRATCPLTGRPGAILVSPDASRLFVLDQEAPRATEAGLLRMERLGVLDFAPHAAAPLRVLGRAGDLFALAAKGGGLAIFDLARRVFVGSIQGGGSVGDFLVPGGGRIALLSLGSGGRGSIELMDLDRWEGRALLSLPGEPVPGTMTLSPRRDRAAVVVGDAGGRAVVAWWTGTSRPFALLPVPDDAGAPVFVEDGRALAVPSRGGSEVRFLDLDRARERGRALMVGRPIQLATAPEDGAAWALCEDVGHVAVLDSLVLRTTARVLLEGVDPSMNRLAFSPEGRLAAVAEGRSGGVALLDADPSSPGCGLLLDRLELGRVPGALAWSPLGDELYVVDALLGAVAAISVDRAGRSVKDTDQYLLDQIRSRMERERRKNPLFPP